MVLCVKPTTFHVIQPGTVNSAQKDALHSVPQHLAGHYSRGLGLFFYQTN